MEIKKFDPKSENIELVSGLILKGYGESSHSFKADEESRKIVKHLIETGNNFLGHENIYLCVTDGEIAGLLIGYPGKSIDKVRTLMKLLFSLKLTQIFNYLIISSILFDAGCTPGIDESDFYISVIVVREEFRNRGIGTFLLKGALLIAKDKGCERIVLDVDRNNIRAQSLYRKFGFIKPSNIKIYYSDNVINSTDTLIYKLN